MRTGCALTYEVPTPPPGMKARGEGWLIGAEALGRGIEVSVTKNGGLRLVHAGVKHRFRRGTSSLQAPLVRRVCRQKELTSRLLRHRGIAAPENVVFGFGQERAAWQWAKVELPVVVKPNSGALGRGVHVGLDRRSRFLAAFTETLETYGSVLVERMLPGVDHRFAMVEGELIAIVRRDPMNVTGDGRSTISQLVKQKNAERKERGNPVHKRLKLDDSVSRKLRAQGLSLESIPAEGQKVFLREAANISAGGDAIDVTDEIPEVHRAFARRVAEAIPGLAYAGLDIMIDGDRAACLEINHAPMFSMHQFPWSGVQRPVWGHVVDLMFPETARSERHDAGGDSAVGSHEVSP